MELLLNLLYFYIAVYSVYFFILALKSLNDKKFRIQQKYSNSNYFNNLCVIIYSHDNEVTLENLVKQLREQKYPTEHFSTYVILDNCSDNSEKLFVNDKFVNVINMKEHGTIGKDQVISILLEDLSATQNCNAYVFLDAKRYIENNFLSTVNAALVDSPVITGSTIIVGQNLTFTQKIKSVFHKYYDNVVEKGRSLIGLANSIDSDILIMRQDLMEQIGCVDFQNVDTELKYSLLLSKIGSKCVFNPNIKSYVSIDDFELKVPSLAAKIELFKNCFTKIWTRNFVFNEHVFSLLAPNVFVLLFAYAYLLPYSYKYYFIVDFSVVLISLSALLLGFCMSLMSSKLPSKEFLYLLLFPFYSIGHGFKNLPLCKKIRNKISGKKDYEVSTEKMTVDVFVTDNKNNIPCKLELISENGLAKVNFIFKKKRFTTSSHLRMVDAISEIIAKLSDYNFNLKICQCCEHFSPNIDGSTNMVKGFCNNQFAGAQSGIIPTLLWNSCRGFKQSQSGGVLEEIFK